MKLRKMDERPIIDAKRPMVLTITPHDIKVADKKDAAHCAAAVACRRGLHMTEARIHLSRAYLRTKHGPWVRYQVSRSLRQEIITFDRGGDFESGEYYLYAPQPSKRADGSRQGSEKDGQLKKKGKSRRPAHKVTNVRGRPVSKGKR